MNVVSLGKIWAFLSFLFFFLLHSAGKSFVAEILMLRRVIMTGKIALFVLPYVSICSEKVSLVNLKILNFVFMFSNVIVCLHRVS